MKCPSCGYEDSKVIDSRPEEDGKSIRRRRECAHCQRRFTTHEIIDTMPLLVIKKDDKREPFDRMKIINGLIKSCYKRPVSVESLEKLALEVENELLSLPTPEIPSEKIGTLVMEKLKKLDEISYVRFASVYREFKDAETFVSELKQILFSREGIPEGTVSQTPADRKELP